MLKNICITGLSICMLHDMRAVFSAHNLISHVQESIAYAQENNSRLSSAVLNIEGMSGNKVRHLLNRVCSLKDANYLEIGTWKGSTFIAALYGNQNALHSATAIDNWSEFAGPRSAFLSNCATFLSNNIFNFHEVHAFNFDIASLKNPIDIYFYDGNHATISQERAFTYYDQAFSDVFIAIVDDWEWQCVQEGTKSAFKKLGYQVLFESELFSGQQSPRDAWWNGVYIAVIQKKH